MWGVTRKASREDRHVRSKQKGDTEGGGGHPRMEEQKE
jgi:hypothetical protein